MRAVAARAIAIQEAAAMTHFTTSRLMKACLGAVLLAVPMRLLGQAPSAEEAATASAQVRQTSEKIKAILEKPELSGSENADARLEKIRDALNERFDWTRISRWVLGRNVRKFDDEHLTRFTNLFSRYVVLYYMAKVDEFMGTDTKDAADGKDVEIVYGDGMPRRDGSVLVTATFKLPNGKEINTSYTLIKDPDETEWKVRNFVVEGVSLVSNWRTELNYIGSRDKILSVLEKKVNSLEREKK
jgi:ABC-type transporter MlaC component